MMHSGVAAVMVTYHSGANVEEAMRATLAQVEKLYLVDNGSEAETLLLLRRVAEEFSGRVTLHENGMNLGLAAAQNQGIAQALGEGVQWVLLLDDDSIPQPGMVAALLEAGDDATAICAPRIVEQGVRRDTRYLVQKGIFFFVRKRVGEGEILRDVALVIASGSLVRAEAFHSIGMMTEGYFIDSVDHEFCLRARAHGYSIVVAGAAALLHRQGEKRRHGAVVTAHYNARRRYYIFRNRMFLTRRFGLRFPFLYGYHALACGWDVLRIVLLEEGKWGKATAAAQGLWHGLTQENPKESRL